MRLPNEVTVEAMDADGGRVAERQNLAGGEGVGGRGDPHNRYEKMKVRLEGRLRSTDREKRRGQKNAWSTKLRQMRI